MTCRLLSLSSEAMWPELLRLLENRDNPDQPIVVKMPDVWKRVREMGKDRSDRIADTAPKALREQMREMARGAS